MQISLSWTSRLSHIWQCRVKIASAVNRLAISSKRYFRVQYAIFVAKDVRTTQTNCKLNKIRFGPRSALTNFLIEYSVFTVITSWQYISLPEYAPMFGFLMRHVLRCIEHVNPSLSWLVAIYDVGRQHSHYSLTPQIEVFQKHWRKSSNEFPLPLITVQVQTYTTNLFRSVCLFVGL